jgi:4'-phosphopantetheinyl transferase
MTEAGTVRAEVAVRVIDLAAWSACCGGAAAVRAVLSPAELRRLDRLRDNGIRARFAAAHVALRCLLGARLGVPPRSLEFGIGIHGKPELIGAATDLEFNLSHSGWIALVAMSCGRRLGVDIEQVGQGRRGVPLAALRLFPPEDAASVTRLRGSAARLAFTRLWTRKEACVKAAGGTLLAGLALPVNFPGEQGLVVGGPGFVGGGRGIVGGGPGFVGGGRDPCPSERSADPIVWCVKDLGVGPGHCAAVALTGSGGYEVDVRPFAVPADALTAIRESTPDNQCTI